MTTPDIAGLCERQLVTITHKLPEVAFLTEAARYFETRPTGGEDAAHWSNVFNAKNCRKAADTLERQAAEIERLREALVAKADEGMLVLETLAKMTPDRAHRHVKEGLTLARKARAALTGEDT
jgi:hypothetical protein